MAAGKQHPLHVRMRSAASSQGPVCQACQAVFRLRARFREPGDPLSRGCVDSLLKARHNLSTDIIPGIAGVRIGLVLLPGKPSFSQIIFNGRPALTQQWTDNLSVDGQHAARTAQVSPPAEMKEYRFRLVLPVMGNSDPEGAAPVIHPLPCLPLFPFRSACILLCKLFPGPPESLVAEPSPCFFDTCSPLFCRRCRIGTHDRTGNIHLCAQVADKFQIILCCETQSVMDMDNMQPETHFRGQIM